MRNISVTLTLYCHKLISRCCHVQGLWIFRYHFNWICQPMDLSTRYIISSSALASRITNASKYSILYWTYYIFYKRKTIWERGGWGTWLFMYSAFKPRYFIQFHCLLAGNNTYPRCLRLGVPGDWLCSLKGVWSRPSPFRPADGWSCTDKFAIFVIS